jgi:hypothetical protein
MPDPSPSLRAFMCAKPIDMHCLNNWTDLKQYVTDGYLSIDDNVSEREMKYVAMGRKGWRFLGSNDSGRNHAIILSILSTCRHHGVEPWAYSKIDRGSQHEPRRPGSPQMAAKILPSASNRNQHPGECPKPIAKFTPTAKHLSVKASGNCCLIDNLAYQQLIGKNATRHGGTFAAAGSAMLEQEN